MCKSEYCQVLSNIVFGSRKLGPMKYSLLICLFVRLHGCLIRNLLWNRL